MSRVEVVVAAAIVAALAAGAVALDAAPAPQTAQDRKTVEDALARAEARQTAGDFAGAVEVLDRALNAEGTGDERLVFTLAVAEIWNGAPDKALGRLKTLLKPEGATPEFYLWSSVAASAAGDQGASAQFLRAGLDAAGTGETALYDLAERFLRAGAPSVSAALYARILETPPTLSTFDVYASLHLAAYRHLSGRNSLASQLVSSVRKAIEYSEVEIMTPQEADYLAAYYAGLGLVGDGDVKGGADALCDAAALLPDIVLAQAAAVAVLDAAGESARADGAYAMAANAARRAAAAAPEKADAFAKLATLAAVSGRNLEEGLAAADRALQIKPLSGDIIATRAAILASLGRLPEALDGSNRAIAILAAPRWAEAGAIDECVWRRLLILKAMGRSVPQALTILPESAPQPPAQETACAPPAP